MMSKSGIKVRLADLLHEMGKTMAMADPSRQKHWYKSHTCELFRAIAMAEMDVDISNHNSKALSEFVGQRFDYAGKVCSECR